MGKNPEWVLFDDDGEESPLESLPRKLATQSCNFDNALFVFPCSLAQHDANWDLGLTAEKKGHGNLGILQKELTKKGMLSIALPMMQSQEFATEEGQQAAHLAIARLWALAGAGKVLVLPGKKNPDGSLTLDFSDVPLPPELTAYYEKELNRLRAFIDRSPGHSGVKFLKENEEFFHHYRLGILSRIGLNAKPSPGALLDPFLLSGSPLPKFPEIVRIFDGTPEENNEKISLIQKEHLGNNAVPIMEFNRQISDNPAVIPKPARNQVKVCVTRYEETETISGAPPKDPYATVVSVTHNNRRIVFGVEQNFDLLKEDQLFEMARHQMESYRVDHPGQMGILLRQIEPFSAGLILMMAVYNSALPTSQQFRLIHVPPESTPPPEAIRETTLRLVSLQESKRVSSETPSPPEDKGSGPILKLGHQ